MTRNTIALNSAHRLQHDGACWVLQRRLPSRKHWKTIGYYTKFEEAFSAAVEKLAILGWVEEGCRGLLRRIEEVRKEILAAVGELQAEPVSDSQGRGSSKGVVSSGENTLATPQVSNSHSSMVCPLATALSTVAQVRKAIGKDGLELPQLTMLLTVAAHPRGINVTELANKTGCSVSGVSRSVMLFGARGRGKTKGLGLLKASNDPFNPKYKIIELSAKGRRTLGQVAAALV